MAEEMRPKDEDTTSGSVTTADVRAVGGLMDDEVANLADVKTFDPAAFAAVSHTHTASQVTDFDASVVAALDAASLSEITPASADKILVRDDSDGGAIKEVPWSSLPSGGTSVNTDEVEVVPASGELTLGTQKNQYATVTEAATQLILPSPPGSPTVRDITLDATMTGAGTISPTVPGGNWLGQTPTEPLAGRVIFLLRQTARGSDIGYIERFFNVADIFAGGKRGFVWDIADLTSMWQDDGQTLAAAVDETVGFIADRSGNGNNVLIPTASHRPILRQTGGGLYYLEWDGVNNFAAFGDRMGFASNPAMTIYAGLTPFDNGSTIQVVFQLGDQDIGDNNLFVSYGSGGEGWAWRYGNGNIFFDTVTFGQAVVARWSRPAGSTYGDGRFFRNGNEISSSSETTPGGTPVGNDAAFVSSESSSGTLPAEMHLFWLAVVEDYESGLESDVEALIAVKAGVSL